MKRIVLALALLIGCRSTIIIEAPAITVAGITVPSGFTSEVFVTGLSSPTAMAFAPDGRLFITQQGGTLRVVKNGALLPAPFLTVTTNTSGERGLVGIAFDPAFGVNNYVYVYYTATTPTMHNRLSRFTANGDVAVPGSEAALLELDDLVADIHNGGSIHFGTDGKLYVGVGDNSVSANAQSLSTRLGKMLRINSDGSIPANNPLVAMTTSLNQAIWVRGLRNPFTFDVQPGTGRIFINDVGNTLWEEINDGIAGSNYGWPTTEGATNDPNFRGPIYTYPHNTDCAITGGTFYNPQAASFPSSYIGRYFFADYCAGWIKVLDPSSNTVSSFVTGVMSPVDLKVGPEGALYYLSRGSLIVGRVSSNACSTQAPQITTQPMSLTISTGQNATFAVAAVGTQPISYQWQRDGSNIPGATSSSYVLTAVMAGDTGASFRAVVTNAIGTATSAAATLTVLNNDAPVPTIDLPSAGLLYSGGDVVTYSGSATDTEDGTLLASAFTWQVDFHHDMHLHPFMAPTSGMTGGSFTIPTLGETSANVWYRILLTVQDSAGVTTTIYRDVLPRTVALTLATSPAGLQVLLDGQPTATPTTFQAVVGIQRTLGAAANGGYTWASWSDSGAVSHAIATPAVDTTYTATFTATPTINLKINFQLAGAPVPSGYDADTGLVFGARADGYSYGWSVDHQSYARDRNLVADQRLDTLIHMHQSSHWDVAVPNGTYDVLVSVGDPGFASTYALRVEGVVYWQWVSLAANQFQQITHTVIVADGKLTVDNWDNGLADMSSRLNYIEISTH